MRRFYSKKTIDQIADAKTIDRIADANDIVELIGSHVPLERAGANFKGLCPFHQESTPSFMVSPRRQTFHCFGCGAGGSVFRFLMNYKHIDFQDAVRKLAERAGITGLINEKREKNENGTAAS
jgi:DNA primase